MGAFTSRRNADVEEVDISTTNAYRYPPKSGCYFGSHFIMGGEKFETTQPEAYLFGENADLNFLGGRPMPFPYPAPQAHEPTKTLKSLVNIRKDSLRFIKAIDNMSPKKGDDNDGKNEEDSNTKYNIEFTFDTDVKVAITIYYFATEEITNGQAVYHPRDSTMNSETYHYKRGANQTFSQTSHIVDPSKFGEEEWQFNPDKDVIPVVVQCVVEEEVHGHHSHILFGYVEKFADGGYMLKPLKQKQMVDGLCYLLQEIYGIENKSRERAKLDDELDDNGSECVICMCETRDTLILPCRHLCLCNMCADNLRYQANNCPICRAPFRALLQIRALRKKAMNSPTLQNDSSDDNCPSQEGVPSGYEAVSLLEALNGPDVPMSPVSPNTQGNTPLMLPDGDSPAMKRKGRRSSGRSSSRRTQKAQSKPIQETRPPQVEIAETAATPEVVMTVHIPEPNKDLAVNPDLQSTEQLVTHLPPLEDDDGDIPTESLNDIPTISLPSEPDVASPAECNDNASNDFEQIKIEDSDDEVLADEDPSSPDTALTQDPDSSLTSSEDKPLCLLQELSLPLATGGSDSVAADGSERSSYSSTSSTKGLLLDSDVVALPQIEQ